MGLRKDQYNRILREYDDRRQQNRWELDQRILHAHQQIPELNEIDQEIASGSIECARLMLSGSPDSLAQLKLRNEKLAARKKRLLADAGFPEDYLELRYHCPDCQDTGYIDNQKCHCFKQAVVDLLYSQSGLQLSLDRENFDTFCLDYYADSYAEESTGLTPRANAERALQICHGFIRDFDTSYQNLLLYGNTGVGKTFLTNCIARELLSTSHTVIYLTAFQLFDALEKYTFQKHEDQDIESTLDYILDCDLLIIDDLGTEMTNAFINSRLYLCLNERDLRQKSTLLSTNLSLDDLSRTYSERIFSRLTSNYIMIKMVGEDIRLQKALQ